MNLILSFIRLTILNNNILTHFKGSLIVVVFTTICAISAYHH